MDAIARISGAGAYVPLGSRGRLLDEACSWERDGLTRPLFVIPKVVQGRCVAFFGSNVALGSSRKLIGQLRCAVASRRATSSPSQPGGLVG